MARLTADRALQATVSAARDGQTQYIDALTELGHEVTVVTGRKLGAPPVQDDAMADALGSLIAKRPETPAEDVRAGRGVLRDDG